MKCDFGEEKKQYLNDNESKEVDEKIAFIKQMFNSAKKVKIVDLKTNNWKVIKISYD